MTYQPAPLHDDPINLPGLPVWVTSGRIETAQAVAFRSGVVLAVLDALIRDHSLGVPVKLLANRMALRAATATSRLEGRLARETDIRDAYHLTPPGDARGPDGDLLAFWREAVRIRAAGRKGAEALEQLVGPAFGSDVPGWLKDGTAAAKSDGPLQGCAHVLRAVLMTDSRAERVACLLADVVLARVLNWKTVLPLSTQRLTKPMLRELAADGPGADLAVQRALLGTLLDAVCCARDLAQRASALQGVAPKLRAKGSDAAVALFLSEDAVAPSGMLSPRVRGSSTPMTDRAARRFCDRLVELGVARELTGRTTFRLYGIAP